MKSGKVLEIRINVIFEIIKNYYSINFPYKAEWNPVSAINLSFENSSYGRVVPGRIKSNENNELVYTGSHNQYSMVFKDGLNIQNLVDDVEALHGWLVNNSYINDGIATEKMITTKGLFF
ncbi:hypothetical protein [Enterobacter cloacae]|uniref:hypothetical protein n=1 Tax=Enterobacter cloacae TaxID=550 RepID=UPI00376F77C4